MKIKKNLFFLIIISIIISLVNSKQFDYEELKKKSFVDKIKYLIIHFFAKIEQYTLYYIMGIRSYDINEPYDFFFCFIIGCFLRIFYLLLKKMFKNIFNINDNNYVYNESSNAEKLYEVNKKLNEFSKKLNDIKENPKENNINDNVDINNINNDLDNNKNNEIEKKIKIVNNKLINLEKIIINLQKSYDEEKNHVKINLKTIEECQKFIMDSLITKEK